MAHGGIHDTIFDNKWSKIEYDERNTLEGQ